MLTGLMAMYCWPSGSSNKGFEGVLPSLKWKMERRSPVFGHSVSGALPASQRCRRAISFGGYG